LAAEQKEDVVRARRGHDARDLSRGIDHEHRERIRIDEQRGVAAEGNESAVSRAVGVARRWCRVGDDGELLQRRVEQHDVPLDRIVDEQTSAGQWLDGGDGAHRLGRGQRRTECAKGRTRRLLRARRGCEAAPSRRRRWCATRDGGSVHRVR
jgi:hypothetical protein